MSDGARIQKKILKLTRVIESAQLDRSAYASWVAPSPAKANLYTERFGISDVRTLFVLATGARGELRLNKCIEVNKYFNKGQGTGLFLFTKAETLLEAPDILEAPFISGQGKTRRLIG